MVSISVVLATYNEESNLKACLESVKNLADEIVVVDGGSADKTVEIAKSHGAKVTVTDNPQIFHINKQKAIDIASSPWILQLDADERVSPALAAEIKKVVSMTHVQLEEYEEKVTKKKLFSKHQKVIEARDGKIGEANGEYAAFFIPRLNNFLGRYLRYGGVYPDGVIRLIRKGKAYLPAKDVHEQMVVKGKVGWIKNDLYHIDSPTFKKYLRRWGRYTTLIAKEIKKDKHSLLTPCKYLIVMPLYWFVLTYVRHKGFLDSWQGFVFSCFSSFRFPVGYLKSL